MTNRYSIILSFLLATLLTAGTVELFYSSLGKVLTASKVTTHEGVKKTPTSIVNKAAQRQADRVKRSVSGEDYTIISKRNLFGETPKTTPIPTSKPDPILTTTSLELMLLGTVGGKPEDQRAIIRNKKTRVQAIYTTGDTIEHALIKKINRSQIILTVNGKDEVLLMEEMKSPPSTDTTKNFAMPKVYTLPNRRVADDTIEMEEDGEILEQLPPTTIPKRRMTLEPKTQQVTEP
jgi:type II secretory pathway component PulC